MCQKCGRAEETYCGDFAFRGLNRASGSGKHARREETYGGGRGGLGRSRDTDVHL